MILDILRSKHVTVTIADGFFITFGCCNLFGVVQGGIVKYLYCSAVNDAVVYELAMY